MAVWRWVFYVNVPVGAAAGIGLGLLMYGVSEGPNLGWGSAEVLGTVGAGVALLIVMIVVELRTAEPARPEDHAAA